MKTENEMNNNGQKTPAAGNGTRKPNFRHKNYKYKAQPKKDEIGRASCRERV